MNQQKRLSRSVQQRHRVVAVLSRSTNAPVFIDDNEFGSIRVRRNARAKHVRLSMGANGELSITLPRFAAKRHALELIETSRQDIRAWQVKQQGTTPALLSGQHIGHSHTLHISAGHHAAPTAHIRGLLVLLELPWGMDAQDPAAQKVYAPVLKKALTIEAKAYLPRQLAYLAKEHGFSYERTRFGAPKGRWGSCSSTGTISLNVALMALDNELIDYVLLHELCHTKHMNHSAAFWSLVETYLPHYKKLRKELKKHHPAV